MMIIFSTQQLMNFKLLISISEVSDEEPLVNGLMPVD